MIKLFFRIILTNIRSILVLFFVLLFASTSFLTLKQITTNVDTFVTSKTKPLFGADIIISVRSYATWEILPMVASTLSGFDYEAAERRTFSTTLLNQENKTWLVQIVAFSWSYPQKWILETEVIWTGTKENERIAGTPGLIEKFSKNGVISLEGREILIKEKINESSDLGFSLGTENHLLILPSSFLSGSMLLSSWSRLDQDLLISFSHEENTQRISESLKKLLPENLYRVRTFEERTERNLDTVETLTEYITLILLVSGIFAFIILRSAHEAFFESISRTLMITHILGLTVSRQRILILILYILIFPLAFWLSIALSDFFISSLRQFPDASDFQFFWSGVPYTFIVVLLIAIFAWFPAWWKVGNFSQKKWICFFTLISPEMIISMLLSWALLFLLFQDWIFILKISVIWIIAYFLFTKILSKTYSLIFEFSKNLRNSDFYFFDGFRTLVRPLIPTIPITLSLFLITTFFLIFASFSLAFRSKLTLDTTNSANIYAINILEKDREWIEKVLGKEALFYDILRARILKINGESLEKHFATEKLSGEFTREFNITTSPLNNKVLSWKSVISKGEVSVDDEFSKMLKVEIGDEITFLLSWREIRLRVANIRESIREWFRPFFFFSFDREEFKNAPRTYFVAEYAKDIEKWKQAILEASGPHVTFIDIESVLKIVRDISSKVLSLIWLFFVIIFLFAVGAIFAFFQRLWPLESQKIRLYSLFWATNKDISISIQTSRRAIFLVSYILSILLGGILSYFVVTRRSFFAFSFSDFLLLALATAFVYMVLMRIMKK